MKEYQKETLRFSVEEEKKVLRQLEQEYKESKNIIKRRIEKLMNREDAELPQVIHQLKWQKAIESEINDVLNKLKDGTYKTIADYMNESYTTGFTSSLYRLQKQGVPLIFPMDREEILRATQLQSKAKGKYSSKFKKAVTVNARTLRNTIKHEVTRGISSSMSFSDVAMNIDSVMGVGLKRAYRIARTEGHRVNQEASFDAMHKAKDAGADIVKQWDSTLDSRTRPHHTKLDGQIRELDDEFEVEGLTAQHPHAFGKASEDINCRCVVLEIAKWELDEDETFTKFDGNDGVIVQDLSNVDNYNEFRKKYNIEVKKKENNFNKNYNNKLAQFIGKDYYDDLHDNVVNCNNQDLSKIWKHYEDTFSIAPNKGGAYFSSSDEKIHISKNDLDELFTKDYLSDGSVRMLKDRTKNQVMFHEAGHNIDYLLGGKESYNYYSTQYKNGAFPELISKEINDRIDEIAKEIKSKYKSKLDDLDWLCDNCLISSYTRDSYKNTGLPDYMKEYIKFEKSMAYQVFAKEVSKLGVDHNANLSDIIEGATYGKIRINYGHGASYWKKRKLYGVNFGLAKEAFAEMIDSTFSNPKQLETIKKYIPKSYKMFEDMIREAIGELK